MLPTLLVHRVADWYTDTVVSLRRGCYSTLSTVELSAMYCMFANHATCDKRLFESNKVRYIGCSLKTVYHGSQRKILINWNI